MRDTFVLPTRLAAIDEARRWASGHAGRAGIDATTIGEIEVAMTEALSNVIRHSYDGRAGEPVQLAVEIDDDRFALEICDRGRAFDPERYRPPDLDAHGDGGYGVYLMEELMDDVIRSPLQDGGTRVTLVRHRAGRS